MFIQNDICKFDIELSVISSIITHVDPYPKLINPKRWQENQSLHEAVFLEFFRSSKVPSYIKHQFRIDHTVDYELLYSILRGPVSAFLKNLDPLAGRRLLSAASAVSSGSTHLFCRQSFENADGGVIATPDRTVPIAIIIPFRATVLDDGRLSNLVGVLRRLQNIQPKFAKLTVVVAESDSVCRHEETVLATGAKHCFRLDGEAFNKSASVNLGYRSLNSKPELVCILDNDALLDDRFVDICLSAMRASGARALMPFHDMFFLDPLSSARARTVSIENAGPLTGYLTRNSPGGCIWVTSDIFERVQGFDEGFRGWGGEDRDFYNKVAALTPISRLPGVFLHLFHERAPEIHAWAERGEPWVNDHSRSASPEQAALASER